MEFYWADGGREYDGFPMGKRGDCVCRGLAIVTGRTYREVYERINELTKLEKVSKRRKRRSNAETGVFRTTSDAICREYGGVWTPTMKIGSGCKVHLTADELPSGRLLVKVSKHMVAVIDHRIYDIYDPSRGGKRCVYGYWTFPNE